MNAEKISCKDMESLMMALMDGELDDAKKTLVIAHLQKCSKCSLEYDELKKVKEIASEMKLKKLPEFYWDEYWKHIYNRIERGLSWLFISIGLIIVLGFSAWYLINSLIADQKMPPLLKGGIYVLLLGFIILIISILREKMLVRKVDKYREIER